MAGSRKARADISPEIRGGLKRAIKIMEQAGRPLSTIWVEMFDEDKFNAMRLAISLLPKELDIELSEAPVDSTMITPELLRDAFNYRRLQLNGPTGVEDSEVH